MDSDTYRLDETIALWGDSNKKKIILRNRQTGKHYSFMLENHFVIGRVKESCDLQITENDKYISGKHVRFFEVGDSVCVEDMGSTNGTRVNGKRISSAVIIRSGDILRIGRTEFEVLF